MEIASAEAKEEAKPVANSQEEANEVVSPQQDIEEKPTIPPATNSHDQVKSKKLAGLNIKNKTNDLSIASLTKKDEVVESEKEAFSSDLRDEFDAEKLAEAWKKMSEWIKSQGAEGNSIVYAALSTHTPTIEPGHLIRLKVDNKSQLEELSFARTDIHDYLRKALRNGAIELETEILKDKKEKKAYTQEEKFQKLAEENPDLLRMKQELDLDFF